MKEADILLKWFPKGVVAFDLETTGLSPLCDKIIEFGGLKLTPDKELLSFQEFVCPGIPLSEEGRKINHITEEQVAHAPPLKEVLPRFMNFVGDLPLVAHNAKFDLGIVVFSLKEEKIPLPINPVYCSLALAKKAFKNMPSYSLPLLSERLGITSKNYHRAFDDANCCLHLTAKALEMLGGEGEQALKNSYWCRPLDYQHCSPSLIPPHLAQLPPMVAQKKTIAIKYSKGKQKNKFRPVTLQSILPLPRGNALYALCQQEKIYKFFFLHRILAIAPLTGHE